MFIFVILPLNAFFIIWILLATRQDGLRRAWLDAALIYGVLVAFSTELLSIPQWLTPWGVGLFWLVVGQAATAQLVWKNRSPNRNAQRSSTYLDWFDALNETPLAYLTILGVILIILLVGLTAFIAPPNNWDSMTYHMSRVANWIDNRSVAHYPTSIAQQLYQHPWAEYAILHLQILSGGDRFANLVQWFSMASSIMGVSVIAMQLGVKRRGQIFAAVICSTIFIGILQGSSTQNDYVVALWGVCLVYAMFRAFDEGFTALNAFRVGAALGLMLLTKATTYVYAFPFIVWFSLSVAHKHHWQLWRRQLWQPLVIVAVSVLLITSGHFLRNIQSFESPLGPHSTDFRNELLTPQAWFSNVMRNFSLHTYLHPRLEQSLQLDTQVISVIGDAHDLMGIDMNDPRTTFTPNYVDWRFGWRMHEDVAPVPFHLLLSVVAVGVYLVRPRHSWRWRLGIYGLTIAAGFTLFCMVLKWQPWGTRLHLPFFVLMSPFIAVVMVRGLPNWVVQSIAIFLLVAALVFSVTRNVTRTLIGEATLFNTDRITLYFENRPELQPRYIEVISIIQDEECDTIGLDMGSDDWEYPLWVLLDDDSSINHVNARFGPDAPSDYVPCAVLHINSEVLPDNDTTLTVNSAEFVPVWTEENVQVLLPE